MVMKPGFFVTAVLHPFDQCPIIGVLGSYSTISKPGLSWLDLVHTEIGTISSPTVVVTTRMRCSPGMMLLLEHVS